MASNIIPGVYFDVNQCVQFIHNTTASNEIFVRITCRYLQSTKDKVLVSNPCKRMVLDCYVDTYFAGLWVHENPQDPICANIRIVFVGGFSNCTLLLSSKIQVYISLYALYFEHVVLLYYFRDFLSFKSLIKEVVDNMGMNSENMKYVSGYTFYEDNNCSIVVASNPGINPASKHIYIE